MIVGISGPAGSGKDFLAQAMVRTWPHFRVLSFATALKLKGLGRGFSAEELFVTKPPHVRQWLQEYGTDVCRAHDPHTWIDKLILLADMFGWDDLLIPDVRFPNELDMCDLTIRVHSDRPRLTGPLGTHSTEHALENVAGWDLVVVNNVGTTASELIDQVRTLLVE